jgi:Nucleotidyl transferase AbiEii toxin, Type IV TA system
VAIKFEIVLEARIELEPPADADLLCGVATLSALDRVTTKLLALSDRWRDDAVHSRDLIDLAMLSPPKKLLRRSVAKARSAYGDSVQADLARAVHDLRLRPHRLDVCMQALGMTSVPKALLWTRMKALLRAAGSTQPAG